jgi:hypothetical protein
MNTITPSGSTPAVPPQDIAAALRGSTVDEMSECSFPASDPPAVWTWEVGSEGHRTAAPPDG